MSFVTPEEFKSYETVAYTKGFLMVVVQPADPLFAPCRRRLCPIARATAKRSWRQRLLLSKRF